MFVEEVYSKIKLPLSYHTSQKQNQNAEAALTEIKLEHSIYSKIRSQEQISKHTVGG